MGPEDAEPLAVGGGRADGEAGGAVGVVVIEVSRRMRHADLAERGVDVRVAQVGQAVADRPAGGDGGEALLHVAAVRLRRAGPTRASTAARCSASRSPRATRWSARGRALSQVQAWKAATSWTWSIRPFCRASRPKRRWRSAATAAMGRASGTSGGGRGRPAPDVGGRGPGRHPHRSDYRMTDHPRQPRRHRSAPSLSPRAGASFGADPPEARVFVFHRIPDSTARDGALDVARTSARAGRGSIGPRGVRDRIEPHPLDLAIPHTAPSPTIGGPTSLIPEAAAGSTPARPDTPDLGSDSCAAFRFSCEGRGPARILPDMEAHSTSPEPAELELLRRTAGVIPRVWKLCSSGIGPGCGG